MSQFAFQLLQISFEKIGLNHKSEFVAGLGEVLTLVDAVKKMGDVGKRISYLKVGPLALFCNNNSKNIILSN